MSKKAIRKGKRIEYLIRDLLKKLGHCERVPCSGNTRAFKHDLILTLPGGISLNVEVKARKKLDTLYKFVLPSIYNNNFASSPYIYNKNNPDFLVLKADRKPPLVVMTLENFIALIKTLQGLKNE